MNAHLSDLRGADVVGESAAQRIFEAARDLFYEQGIRAVGVEAIVAAAGTTKMTLYRNYSSKDELLAAILKTQDEEFWAWWDSVIEPLEGKPREQIERLFSSFEELACDEGSCRGCPIANAAVEITDDDNPARKIVKQHHDEMRRRLRELSRNMNARDPERLGDALFLLMGGSFLSLLVFDDAGPSVSVHDAARLLLDSSVGAPVEQS
ncbi:MAG: TetR/AcrR family transcriptional regulator [Woeseiaceae bacterium]